MWPLTNLIFTCACVCVLYSPVNHITKEEEKVEAIIEEVIETTEPSTVTTTVAEVVTAYWGICFYHKICVYGKYSGLFVSYYVKLMPTKGFLIYFHSYYRDIVCSTRDATWKGVGCMLHRARWCMMTEDCRERSSDSNGMKCLLK